MPRRPWFDPALYPALAAVADGTLAGGSDDYLTFRHLMTLRRRGLVTVAVVAGAPAWSVTEAGEDRLRRHREWEERRTWTLRI